METKNPGRALVLASGTPITNTLGEMFSVQRYLGFDGLHQRGLHEFDAWASTFGDVTTELELQPNGKYKPVTRFATFGRYQHPSAGGYGRGTGEPVRHGKAIASGDLRLMQKAGLEAHIARLERLRAAHQDDQFAIRRQTRDAERDIEYSTRRIGEIGQDIELLLPTTGDAFCMRVGDETFVERKLAGRALMKEILTLVQLQQEGDSSIASPVGFDLECSGERFGKDGYSYTTMLMRTGADYEIELPVTTTPLGAVALLEHGPCWFQ